MLRLPAGSRDLTPDDRERRGMTGSRYVLHSDVWMDVWMCVRMDVWVCGH